MLSPSPRGLLSHTSAFSYNNPLLSQRSLSHISRLYPLFPLSPPTSTLSLFPPTSSLSPLAYRCLSLAPVSYIFYFSLSPLSSLHHISIIPPISPLVSLIFHLSLFLMPYLSLTHHSPLSSISQLYHLSRSPV